MYVTVFFFSLSRKVCDNFALYVEVLGSLVVQVAVSKELSRSMLFYYYYY